MFAGAWPDPAEDLPPPEDNRLAQPYGGYISPGSTLDELRVFISQWNTGRAATSAVPGHPVRGQPAQALVTGLILAFRPQSVRSRTEGLVEQTRAGLAGAVVRVRP